jgi:hypothetical protein
MMIELLEIQLGSPVYSRADGGTINCLVRLSSAPEEWRPFTANPLDPAPHAQAVWAALQTMDIAPYVAPPVPVPASVSPLQMRKALRQAELKAAADAYLATLDEEAVEAWEYAVTILRADPFIEGARVALGMSQSEADDLFRLAATL